MDHVLVHPVQDVQALAGLRPGKLMSWQLACLVMQGWSVWPQVMPSMAAPDFGLSSEGHSHANETGKQLASAA